MARTIEMSPQLNRAVRIASATMEMSAQAFITASISTAVVSMAEHDPTFAGLLRSKGCLVDMQVPA
jgi:hypothetical protein